MFDWFRREGPELQLYGKLPLAKDYLRVGASKGTGRELREWLDHSFSSRAVDGKAPRFAWPARFILGAVPGEPVMGAVWPSSDTGGERDFPFATFVARRQATLAKAFHHGLEGLNHVWEQLAECHAASARFTDGQSFLADMRGRLLDVQAPKNDTGAASARLSWEAWVNALWPSQGQDGLVAVLVALGALQKPHALRLPMVANRPLIPQVHAWWTALVSLNLVPANNAPTVFFPQADVPAGVPAFASFLAAGLRHEHAAWIGPARAERTLGPGDFATASPAYIDPSTPAPEGAPDLAVSMRGAVATARSRL